MEEAAESGAKAEADSEVEEAADSELEKEAEPETEAVGEPEAESASRSLADVSDEYDEDLAAAAESLVRLQRAGTLDDLVSAADTISLASAALDDGMVQRLAATGTTVGELADTATEEDVADGLDDVLVAVGEAKGQGPPDRVGFVGLARALRDPAVQTGLGYLLSVLRALGREAERE